MLFIVFLSEIFLSNGSLNCSLGTLWFLTDLIWHSVRPSLSKHCATRWFHLGKGGYVVRNRAHLTDLLQFIFWALCYFLKQLILTKNGPFLPKPLHLHPPLQRCELNLKPVVLYVGHLYQPFWTISTQNCPQWAIFRPSPFADLVKGAGYFHSADQSIS